MFTLRTHTHMFGSIYLLNLGTIFKRNICNRTAENILVIFFNLMNPYIAYFCHQLLIHTNQLKK